MSVRSEKMANCPDGFRWCSGHDRYLPLMWFYKNEGKCRDCKKQSGRETRLKDKFGLTADEYEHLLKYQNGRCAICGNEPKTIPFAVDHDHNTRLIRGILCMWCNHRLLGGARERISLLRRAIEYLEHPPAINCIGERKVPQKK